MAYISKVNILAAYRQLSKLTNDPSAQGATQATSSLRYFFALANFYTKFSRPCNTRLKEDKEWFIKFVGDVVSINDNYYTANFFNALKKDADYKVGSNFFSVNVVKTSLENSSKDYVFPKRGNSPLFIVRNGELILREDYFNNISSILYNSELCSAFCIWLVRNDKVDESNVYESIRQILTDRYSASLVEKFLPERNSFSTFESLSFNDTPAYLEIDDFPKVPIKDVKERDSDSHHTEVNYAIVRSLKDTYSNDELANILQNMYADLGFVGLHLFGLKYGEFLCETDLKYICKTANISENYHTELNKMRNLYNAIKNHKYGICFYEDFNFDLKKALETSNNSDKTYNEYLLAMRTKPFLLLAGISGTGKSRIVKQMAFDSCPDNPTLRSDLTSPGNYCLIEVKPNWHDSTELIGYESQIGKPHYQLTPFIKFLAKAMLYPDVPFFVCLDEMNLAPVEQYFAEFLSVLESRTKIDGHIVSEPLIKAEIFRKYNMEKSLFSHEEETTAYSDTSTTVDPESNYGRETEVYSILKEQGLRIPENVIVIGTVNMDETTHQFSRKVIDRAMTIEMNLPEGDPFMDFFANGSELAYRTHPNSPSLYIATETRASDVVKALAADNAGKTEWLKGEVAAFLTNLNGALEGTPFKVAYRVQNELMLYFYQLWLEDKSARWRDILSTACDQILMMKVLPRVEGDEELLEKPLEKLAAFSEPYPNALKKIKEMTDRLGLSRFASFWP